MDEYLKQSMRNYKIVVLPLDIDTSLADRLVNEINLSTGRNIAIKCEGPPKTILQKADKCNIELVVFYGTEELAASRMTIRDMAPRKEYKIPLDELSGFFAMRYKPS